MTTFFITNKWKPLHIKKGIENNDARRKKERGQLITFGEAPFEQLMTWPSLGWKNVPMESLFELASSKAISKKPPINRIHAK